MSKQDLSGKTNEAALDDLAREEQWAFDAALDATAARAGRKDDNGVLEIPHIELGRRELKPIGTRRIAEQIHAALEQHV